MHEKIVQGVWIAELRVFISVEGDLDYVLAAHAFFQQMRLEEVEEQITLPASADARHDLDETVALCIDKPIEVEVSLDFHGVQCTISRPANQECHSIFTRTSDQIWNRLAADCANGRPARCRRDRACRGNLVGPARRAGRYGKATTCCCTLAVPTRLESPPPYGSTTTLKNRIAAFSATVAPSTLPIVISVSARTPEQEWDPMSP